MNFNRKKAVKAVTGILLCVAMLISILNIESGSPQNPIGNTEAVSSMLTSDNTILFDKETLDNIDNANINAGQIQEPEDVEEQNNEEKKQEEEKSKEQKDKNDKNNEDRNDDSDGDSQESEKLRDPTEIGDISNGRIDISQLVEIKENSGQGGGPEGQLPSQQPGEGEGNREETVIDKYFETSIVNNDVVKNEDYTFTITHLKPELEVSGVSVILNGDETAYKGSTSVFSLKLAEGENSITVKAVYYDGSRYITASKLYTVYYSPAGKVIIVTDLRNCTVPNDSIDFTAYALQDEERLSVTVKVNGRKISGLGESFTASLNMGDNTITLTAGGRKGSVTETYTVTYREDIFMIKTSISSTVITDDTYQANGQYETVYITAASENYKFSVSVNKQTGVEKIRKIDFDGKKITQGADGYYAITLQHRSAQRLVIYYTDSQGNDKYYNYILRFTRTIDDNTPEDKEPTIFAQVELGNTIFNLENGMVFKSPDVVTIVSAKSSSNETIYDGSYSGDTAGIQVWINGIKLSPISQTGSSFGYNTYLNVEGENTITIRAIDKDGYSVTKTYRVYYEKGDVTVTISVDATTAGLGYLVQPTEVTVPGGTPLSKILNDLLEARGYSVNHGGSVDYGYYLQSIDRPGICNGYRIDPELMQIIVEDGMDDTGSGFDPKPASMDSLGEFDFYRWSGWMYSYNGRFPGYGMDACKPQDGAVIKVRFTLALGKDIGGFSTEIGSGYGETSHNYYKIW